MASSIPFEGKTQIQGKGCLRSRGGRRCKGHQILGQRVAHTSTVKKRGKNTPFSLLFLTSACWETSRGSTTSVRAWRGWFGRESGREDPAGVPRRAAPAATNPSGVSAGRMEPTLTTTRAGREFPLELGRPHSPSLVAADLGSCPDADSNFSNFVV